ncbi:MAG TPA: class I SAM-dependent methyltransferase [Mycobacterium sp.]
MDTTETWRNAFANRSLATSFQAQAALYARLRPEYPAAAIDVAVPAGAVHILDLGAGTGKLTGALVEHGLRVIAVEPLAAMLAELRRSFPQVDAIAGTAESIPLGDGVVDSVMVGQAFHWFDPTRALPEMARVLRPGGALSLLWNHDDERDPLVLEVQSALDRAGRPPGGSTGRGSSDGQSAGSPDGSRVVPFSGFPALSDPVLQEVSWTREQPIEDYIDLQHTYSYVIRASDQVRARLDMQVRAALDRHQPGADRVRVPVICQVWRSDRR